MSRDEELAQIEGFFDKRDTNQDEIDYMCDQLFGEAPKRQPIAFKPRKGNNLDASIKDIIDVYDIRMPVKHIKDNLYLVGSDRKLCELKADRATIRHGGGYEPLQEYLPANDRRHQRKLVQEMLQTDQSLEWVVDQHIQAKRIHTTNELPSTSPSAKYSKPRRSSASSSMRDGLNTSSRSSSRTPSAAYNKGVNYSGPGTRSLGGLTSLRASPSTRSSARPSFAPTSDW